MPSLNDGVDTTVPNVGRMYDYLLGGKDNFAVDRAAAAMVLRAFPRAREMAQENRRVLGRMVRYLAKHGIRQFIDLGTGLPTQGHVHQVLNELHLDDCRVVYVDDDPIVQAHAAAFIGGFNAVLIQCDLRKPEQVLEHPDTRKLIDFDEPVGLLSFAVWHFSSDEDGPAALVGDYMSALAPDSYLAYTHVTNESPDVVAALTKIYKDANHEVYPRPVSAIEALATDNGLVVQDPGIVPVTKWNPGQESLPPSKKSADQMWLVGGVAQQLAPSSARSNRG